MKTNCYCAAYAQQARNSKVLGWTDTRLSKTPAPTERHDGRGSARITKRLAPSLKVSYQATPKNRVMFVAQPS
jgi:hypothetical protein